MHVNGSLEIIGVAISKAQVKLHTVYRSGLRSLRGGRRAKYRQLRPLIGVSRQGSGLPSARRCPVPIVLKCMKRPSMAYRFALCLSVCYCHTHERNIHIDPERSRESR